MRQLSLWRCLFLLSPYFLPAWSHASHPDTIIARDSPGQSHYDSSCGPIQQQVISEAFSDTLALINAIRNLTNLEFDPGAIDFFGESTINKYTSASILQVFDSAAKILPNIFVTCDNGTDSTKTDDCADPTRFGGISSPTDESGNQNGTVQMKFCADFFATLSLRAEMLRTLNYTPNFEVRFSWKRYTQNQGKFAKFHGSP